MKIYFKIISIFLLVCISFNLMAEISHFSETHETNVHSFQKNPQPINNTNSENSNCQDGCHMGGCFLSHCSPLVFSSFYNFYFYSSFLGKDQIKFEFLTPDSPYLEGLKRPPRIS